MTEIKTEASGISIRPGDKIFLLGSCFSDEIGRKMTAAGFDVLSNPFGTLYNPSSMSAAVSRLESGTPFVIGDCVGMGAGSDLICSFNHHTSSARRTAEEFLTDANSSLASASLFWSQSGTVVITLGTSWVWRWLENGMVVANCLKRPSSEFSHEMLGMDDCESLISGIVRSHPEKKFIFTVSPVRHLWNGAHSDKLSKSTLFLSVDRVVRANPNAIYFPAYEILMDELRDYRFYSDDLCHPSDLAVRIIWERFVGTFVPESELCRLAENERAARRAAHRPICV